MKKFLTVLFAVMMILTLAGCAKEEPEEEVEMTTAHGEYTISNNTGKNVGEIYIYPVGSTDKGTNYVHQAFENGELHYDYLDKFHAITVDASDDAKFAEWTGAKDELAHFNLEFYSDEGDLLGTFEGLALEGPVTMVLTTEDTKAGATPIDIDWYPGNVSEYTMNVQFFNKTGSTITALKAVNTGTNEEIDILAELGATEFKADEELDWSYTCDLVEANTTKFNIVWTYGNGLELSLVAEGHNAHALSFENTGMELLAEADIAAGATTVNWPYYVAK